MTDPIINIFYSDSRVMKKPEYVQAKPVTLWKCGRCGANLLTSERRGAKIMGTIVKCSNCFTDNELQPVAWRGQPSVSS